MDDRDQLGQLEVRERAVADRLRGLSRETLAPRSPGQSPAELRASRKLGKERRIRDADESDELAAQVSFASFDREEPEPVLFPVPGDALIPRRQTRLVVQIAQDFGIPIDLRHRRFVVFTPTPQDQPGSCQLCQLHRYQATETRSTNCFRQHGHSTDDRYQVSAVAPYAVPSGPCGEAVGVASPTVAGGGRIASRSLRSLPLTTARFRSAAWPAFRALSTTGSPQGGNQT